MNGSHYVRRQGRFDELAPLFADFEFCAQQGLGRRRAQTNDDLWLYQFDFSFKPGTAGSNLARIWFFVDPSFTARLPFEMLDHVRDVSFRASDAGFVQRII